MTLDEVDEDDTGGKGSSVFAEMQELERQHQAQVPARRAAAFDTWRPATLAAIGPDLLAQVDAVADTWRIVQPAGPYAVLIGTLDDLPSRLLDVLTDNERTSLSDRLPGALVEYLKPDKHHPRRAGDATPALVSATAAPADLSQQLERAVESERAAAQLAHEAQEAMNRELEAQRAEVRRAAALARRQSANDQWASAYGVTTATLDGELALEPLIEGWLYQRTLSQVIGAPGAHKSFLMLSMAAAVAAGEPWHGYATVRGPVVYVVAEGWPGTPKRIRAWETHHGRLMSGVHFVPRAVQIMKDDELAELVRFVGHHGATWLIIDTRSQTTVGWNENDNTALAEVAARLQTEIVDALDIAVTVVHHEKDGRSRGAPAFTNATQTELRLSRSGSLDVLEGGRQKDDDRGGSVSLLPQVVHLLDDGGEPTTSIVLTRPGAVSGPSAAPAAVDLLAVLTGRFPDGMTRAEGHDYVVTELGQLAKTTFYRQWAALVQGGALNVITGTQRYRK